MEEKKLCWNFDNISLEDLESIEASLKSAMRKKRQERRAQALSEFRKAYERFRDISSEDSMYVEVYCEECTANIDVDLVNLLDNFFNL